MRKSVLIAALLAVSSSAMADNWVESRGAWAPIYVNMDSKSTHPENAGWKTADIMEPNSPQQRTFIRLAFDCSENPAVSFSPSFTAVEVKQGKEWVQVGSTTRDYNWRRFNASTPAAIHLARQVACK